MSQLGVTAYSFSLPATNFVSQQHVVKQILNITFQSLNALNAELNVNKRLSQQPALEVLTFLRSFVAGKANFCSHLITSLVHFSVVKSQAILIIRLGVAEVVYHSSWGHRRYLSFVLGSQKLFIVRFGVAEVIYHSS